MITTATIEQVNKALDIVNKKYNDNIIFQREPEQVSSHRVRFTLRVKDSSKKGARRGFYTNQDGSRKKSIAACWHVHGDFFDTLIELEPEVLILAGTKRITAEGGNWQDWNIGSIIQPLYYSEACEC